MAADVINLRQARKGLQRAAKEKQAAENRVKFGRTKVQRREDEAGAAMQRERFEAHRRETDVGRDGEDA